ncbi:MAG: RNA 3'-terminal phosphate cyclase [Deltaproteobacteria bacterium]|nr:RNA 3'-terminal phosphate cyclase [Deltaproteobacteria bacterium]
MTQQWIEIDGSEGEGGGQIFRSSLALSMVTGNAVRVRNIRAGRRKPGLLRQHLTALVAAQEICRAEVQGADLGSAEVLFEPGPVIPGRYSYAMGTAGSTTLVVQALLPALLVASGPSELVLEGGTHNPSAPPFDFLARSLLPALELMGPRVSATLERAGFYPAGGGKIRVQVEPSPILNRIDLEEVGDVGRRQGRVLVANLPGHIGRRELRHLEKRTGWPQENLHLEELADVAGPGNVVLLELGGEVVTEVISSFGVVGVRAEAVVGRGVQAMQRFLKARVPVGEYLADQLLVPMAMAGAGSMLTLPLSRHSTTQIGLIQQFLDVPIHVERLSPPQCRVVLG